jgi:PAS domain S-box-containing protein
MIGLGVDELSAKRVRLCDYVHPDDTSVVDALLAHREGGSHAQPYDTELRLRTPDGTYRWFTVRQQPLTSSKGHIEFVDIVASDITATKLLEREIRELRPLAAAGQKAAELTHDIRNQLTAALGNLELALSTQNGTTTSGTTASLLACKASLSTALELSRDFSTPLCPDTNIGASSCDIALVVAETTALFLSQLPPSAELRLEYIPAVTVPISRAQLQNALLNLLINARDALPSQGGCITIRGKKADCGSSCSVALTISDNGYGIPAEILPKIFEPYITTKRESGGTGLGLASVRSSITRVGGEISLASVQGSGTTCSLSLPICDDYPNAAATARTVNQIGLPQPLSMLIADDEPAIRSMLELALQRKGHAVVSVADGAALLKCVSDPLHVFDVILLDESMPESPGRTLVHNVRALRPTTPIIITSGNYTVAQELAALGPRTQFLAKPFDLAQLDEAIAVAFQHS